MIPDGQHVSTELDPMCAQVGQYSETGTHVQPAREADTRIS